MSTGPQRLWARIGARVYDPFLTFGERRGMALRRRELLASARGRVLEIGAGTGLNLEHYPLGVDELVLTEPSRRCALARAARFRVSPGRHGRGGARGGVAVRGRGVRHGVSTLVLCTVADPVAALREVRRVLVSGGRLLFVEHVPPVRRGWRDGRTGWRRRGARSRGLSLQSGDRGAARERAASGAGRADAVARDACAGAAADRR